jgi:hypothetical protein
LESRNAYQLQLITIRRELFEVVPILTLAYVSGAAVEQKSASITSPSSLMLSPAAPSSSPVNKAGSDDKKLFDATSFFDHAENRLFWSQHVGASV